VAMRRSDEALAVLGLSRNGEAKLGPSPASKSRRGA